LEAETKAAAGRYRIDRNASRFTVGAFASGMLSALGHNPTIAVRDFQGDIGFDPEHPETASLRIEIQAASLEVTNDVSNKDRTEMESVMNRDVLQSSEHPAIAFESSSVAVNKVSDAQYRVNINGLLTLRGVTETQRVPARVTLMGDMLRAEGEFEISQREYGIKPVSVAGGALKLKDELKLTFSIVGRKQE
jgi:polyisoprenoid-binding protein YceI